jgi:hypothetical protein
MKRKLFIGMGVVCIAAAAVCVTFGVNHTKSTKSDLMTQNLEALTDPEGGDGGTMANACCAIWDVEITTETTFTGPKVTVTCSTDGDYKCNDCDCPYS